VFEKMFTPVCVRRTDSDMSLLFDTIKGRLRPQINKDIPDAIYQQDMVPPHFHNKGTTYIDDLPNSYIRYSMK